MIPHHLINSVPQGPYSQGREFNQLNSTSEVSRLFSTTETANPAKTGSGQVVRPEQMLQKRVQQRGNEWHAH